jgi:hypothetical protein
MLEQILIWATIIGGLAAIGYFLEKMFQFRKKWRRFRQRQQTQRTQPITNDAITIELPQDGSALNSSFYIERPPTESDSYQKIIEPGALIHIQAPHYFGKTSLMKRILQHANNNGHRTVSLSFRQADKAVFTDLDSLLQWFCSSVTEACDLSIQVADYWQQGILGGTNRCSKYIQKHILPEINGPLTLGLDDVDKVFKYPDIAEDFLGMLRVWHDRGQQQTQWQTLRLVIVYSQEYTPSNIDRSPFNVGLPIKLTDLTLAQVQDLSQRHGLAWNTKQVKQLMAMVGGHPYLLRLALYPIARQRVTLDKLLQIAPTQEGPYYDHLYRLLLILKDAKLENIMKQIATAEQPIEISAEHKFKLHSFGLIEFHDNTVRPRCNLYRHYFSTRL